MGHKGTDWSTIGTTLRALRKERGFGLYEFGEMTGLGAHAISRIERNGALPRLYTLERVARGFGLKTSELVAYLETH